MQCLILGVVGLSIVYKHCISSIFIIFIVVTLDQFSKFVIVDVLHATGDKIAICPFFNLVAVWNEGVAFGVGSELGRKILTLLSGSLCFGLVVFLFREIKRGQKWLSLFCLSTIIGGGVGNLIDRVRFGAVFDFLDFYISEFHWPAFNLADCAVVLGVFFLCIDVWFLRDRKK